MKLKMLFGLLLSLLTLAMFGCGGDGGGASSTVSGTVAAGIVSGGTVTFVPINADGTLGTALTSDPSPVTTAADGSYGPVSISYSGPLLVTVTGGTYIDEATGVSTTLATPLRAVVPNATGTVAVNITPLTEVATQKAGGMTGGLIAANITAANTAISTLTNVTDILATSPATDANYKQSLQVFSQAQKDQAVDLPTALSNLSAGITITGSTATLDAATQAVINTASTNITTNPNIAATVVALSASPATGVINSPVTVTAAVTFASNGQAVPDGAVVNFSVTSGAGTLSAATAVTSGGNASVTLTDATAEQVVVSAKAANSSAATLTVPFINDPNAPGGITIAANPTSLFVGQGSVTLTATVTPVGTGGVIADGTVVTFTTTLGTITAPTVTTGGVATAVLNSTVAGTASVTASVNGIQSTPVSVTFKAQPTQAIVKLATTGTLPAGTTIGGINCNVTYSTNVGLSIADANVVLSGTGVGSLIIPNTTVPGTVGLALVNAPTGITSVGEFLTLTFAITAGNFPTAADFSVALTGAGVIDANGTTISPTPINVAIASVTIQ